MERRKAGRYRKFGEVDRSTGRRKLAPVIAVAGGAVVIVAALVIALSVTGGKKSTPGATNLNMTTDVNEMLRGIPQHGALLGSPKAKLTLVEFADPQCTACAEFSGTELPTLIQDYVRTGEMRIEYVGQTFIDHATQDSVRLLRMALASGRQNKFWNFIEIVYSNQGAEDSGYATDSYLKSVAAAVPGLNVDKTFAAASTPGAFAAQIKTAADRFKAMGFGQTPMFLLGRTGHEQQKLGQAELAASIDAMLKS
jgi:protein-disulfide isomerase